MGCIVSTEAPAETSSDYSTHEDHILEKTSSSSVQRRASKNAQDTTTQQKRLDEEFVASVVPPASPPPAHRRDHSAAESATTPSRPPQTLSVPVPAPHHQQFDAISVASTATGLGLGTRCASEVNNRHMSLFLFDRLNSVSSLQSARSCASNNAVSPTFSTMLHPRVKPRSSIAGIFTNRDANVVTVRQLAKDSTRVSSLCSIADGSAGRVTPQHRLGPSVVVASSNHHCVKNEFLFRCARIPNSNRDAFIGRVQRVFMKLPRLGQKNTQDVHWVELGDGLKPAESSNASSLLSGSLLSASASLNPPSQNVVVFAEHFELGDLTEFVAADPDAIMTEGQLRDFMRQLVLSLRYMHKHHTPHLFLSSQSIYFRSPSDVVVGNYGLGLLLAHYEADDLFGLLAKGGRCDMALFPPEFILGASKLSDPLATDLWGLGIVARQILQQNSCRASGEASPEFQKASQEMSLDHKDDFFDAVLNLDQTTPSGYLLRAVTQKTDQSGMLASFRSDGDGSEEYDDTRDEDLGQSAMENLIKLLLTPDPAARSASVGGSLDALLRHPALFVRSFSAATSPDPETSILEPLGCELDLTPDPPTPSFISADEQNSVAELMLDDLVPQTVATHVSSAQLFCSACSRKLLAVKYECQQCTGCQLCQRCYSRAEDVHPRSHTFASYAIVTNAGSPHFGARSHRGPAITFHGVNAMASFTSMSSLCSTAHDEPLSEAEDVMEQSIVLPTSALTPHEKNMLTTMGHLPSTLSIERRLTTPTPARTVASSQHVKKPGLPPSGGSRLMSEQEAHAEADVDSILDEFLAASASNDCTPPAMISLANLAMTEFPTRLLSLEPSVSFVSVTVLDLANNSLESIPEEIETLVNLRKLSLENNKLTSLPDSIGQLDDLHELDLNHNMLTSVPDSLLCCEQLVLVMLDYNQLTTIPNFVFDHPSLQEVFLVENIGIRSWPPPDALRTISRGMKIGIDNAPGLCPLSEEQASCLNGVVVVWHKLYPDRVLPNLYLGSLRTAQDQRVYDALNIQHVLTVGRGLAALPPHGTHKIIVVDDIVGANIENSFSEAVAYLNSVLPADPLTGDEAGEACLVHCFAGLSRSATTVIAFLMMSCGMRLDNAYLLVKKHRPAIHPNAGFFEQLVALDKKIFHGPSHRPIDITGLGR
jgi:serine/threonine protein kinase